MIFARCLPVLLAIALFWSGAAIAAPEEIADADLEARVLDIIRNHPEAILDSVRQYRERQNQEQAQIRDRFGRHLRAEPAAVVGDAPATGPLEGRVVAIEFSDFQCPFCAQLHATLNTFLARHPDEVTLVYKHLPLAAIHPQARPASQAAWAAHQQGQFWSYHDALFARANQLGDATFRAIATDLGLNLEQFERDRASAAAAAAIERDVALAASLGLNGTPDLFLGATFFEGAVTIERLEAALSSQAN